MQTIKNALGKAISENLADGIKVEALLGFRLSDKSQIVGGGHMAHVDGVTELVIVIDRASFDPSANLFNSLVLGQPATNVEHAGPVSVRITDENDNDIAPSIPKLVLSESFFTYRLNNTTKPAAIDLAAHPLIKIRIRKHKDALPNFNSISVFAQ